MARILPPVIALTPGEPAGIGPDICLALLQSPADAALVLLADPAVLTDRARLLGYEARWHEWTGRPVRGKGAYLAAVSVTQPVHPGQLDPGNAGYVIETLTRAAHGCLHSEFDALVTGPVHKGNLNDAGIAFSGHTEFLADLSGDVLPVMMLAGPALRVALATTHLPLAQVPQALTRERLRRVIEVLHRDLRKRFEIPAPVILVCGLNPHAGESGHLGREEIETIGPVISELNRRGMRLRGPVPADTAFIPSQLAGVDAVLTMYHDQGLPVVKHHDFAHAVNVTLGLPFIRTSVDHGTALELAGTGRADPTSLRAAFDMALELVRRSGSDARN